MAAPHRTRSKTSPARRPATHAARPMLRAAHPAVRSQLASTVDLRSFLATEPGALTPAERIVLVEQALVLLEQNYVHLPLKRAMHAVDPVQKLRLLRGRLGQTPTSDAMPEIEFHREMLEIFASVRDLHTNYILPAPFGSRVAFLPFMVEDYRVDGERRYLVSHVMQGFSHPTFGTGVEVRYWNGVPIERAALANGERYAGSNLDARHARGVETLTIRALATTLPPDEEWVTVGYTTAAGDDAEVRVDWLVFAPDGEDAQQPQPGVRATRAALGRNTALGFDIELEWIRRARKVLFAPQVVEKERELRAAKRAKKSARAAAGDLSSTMPDTLEAARVETPHGAFGYLRIRTFSVDDPQSFIDECVRLVELLPQRGLILDVRENGGGHIYASEGLLQLFTPRTIEPEPTQFINTPLNLRMCKRHLDDSTIDLSPWIPSMEQALMTGAVYSAGVPITPAAFCNSIGQRYFGPVALVTDALCYSATDIFAAGFQDHGIGPVIGTDGNTGAGGANVWTHELLSLLFTLPDPPDRQSPYRALPKAASMRVSIRRTLRVGARMGTPVEDLGVVPDRIHEMSRRDLLDHNVDLIRAAAAELAARPVYALAVVERTVAGNDVTVQVETEGFDRLDVYLNRRPQRSVAVVDGRNSVLVERGGNAPAELLLHGFSGDALVAARRVAL